MILSLILNQNWIPRINSTYHTINIFIFHWIQLAIIWGKIFVFTAKFIFMSVIDHRKLPMKAWVSVERGCSLARIGAMGKSGN